MDLTRREFVVAAGAAAACVSCSDAMVEAAAETRTIDAGALSDYAQNGVYDRFAKSDKIMLVRNGDRLYATTAICSHRNCTIKPVGSEMRCPCHGSRYSIEGNV